MTTQTRTQIFLNEYTNLIDTEKEYTPSELRKLVTEVYNTINGTKPSYTKKSKTEPSKAKKQKREPKLDSDGNVVKRAPTEYNIFIKENLPLIKEEFPSLTRTDLMKIAAEKWQKSKVNTTTQTNVYEVEEESQPITPPTTINPPTTPPLAPVKRAKKGKGSKTTPVPIAQFE